MKELRELGMSYAAIGREYELSGSRVRQIVQNLPSNKPITAACELCGKVRTGKGQTSLGLICKACYLQNAAEPRPVKPVKEVIKVVRQTYAMDRYRRFIDERQAHND